MKKTWIIIVLCLSILLTACAKTDDGSNQETADVSALVASVEVGMTYAEVAALLGEASAEFPVGRRIFVWHLPNDTVWWGCFGHTSDGETVLFQFEQATADISSLAESVKYGMTYAETVALLGESSMDVGSGLIIYAWVSTDGSVWMGWFQKPLGESNPSPDLCTLTQFEKAE